MKQRYLILSVWVMFFVLTSVTLKAQSWDWNGSGSNETVRVYV